MSELNYISLPVETDATALATITIQRLQALSPGWIPNESNLEVALIEALAMMDAETQFVQSSVATSIFRYAGKSLYNIQPIDGAPATATSTWTMRDTAGYVVPANTVVVYQPTGSTGLYFRTQADVTVPAGSDATANGEVVLVAMAYGSAYNGLEPQSVNLVDALSFVTSVESTTTTADGVDAETDDAYLSRLRTELTLLAPRPILPGDFAAMALNIAGVGRATAVDGYNPVDGTMNNERMVAVAIADSGGRAVTSQVKEAVTAYLEAQREVNFIVNVIDPSYTSLDVTATIKVLDGYDPDSVIDAVVLAVQSYLAPANWDWSPVIRYYELVTLISDVEGVDYLVSLSQPSADVTLPGVAALVTAGSVSVTAT